MTQMLFLLQLISCLNLFFFFFLQDNWRKKTRKRLPGPLDDDVYDMILEVLQGKLKMSDIKKKDRKPYQRKAYRQLKTGAYSIQNVQNPLSGLKELRLVHTPSSKLVVRKAEIPEMVRKISRQTRGEGAKKIKKRLISSFASVSQQRIQCELNRDPAQQRRYPSFKNMAPLRPVKASSVMIRNQIDLVDLRNIAITIDDQKFQWVLSVMDLYSRFVWLRALQSKSSDEVAIKLRDIYIEFGTPKFVQSDQGREFKGAVEKLCRSLNIKIIHSSAYHPQSQGKIERSNRTWKQKLQDDLLHLEEGLCWLDFLPRYQKLYNEAQHEALGPFSPFEIFYGRKSRSDQDILVLGKDHLNSDDECEVEERHDNDPSLRWPSSSDDDTEDIDDLIFHLKSMEKVRKEAECNSDKAARGMIKMNLRKNPPSRYDVGDEVIVQVKRKDNRLKRGSTNLTIPRVCRGTVIEVNHTNHKYKVKVNEGKPEWFKVNQITSTTKEEENFRQQVQKGKAMCNCKISGCTKNYDKMCKNKMSQMCCFCVGENPCLFHLSTISPSSDLNFLLRMKTMEKKKLSSGSDYDNLIRNALEFGLIERGTTPSDGNCMFHCLSIQLSEILHRRISHSDVRKACINFLRENPQTTDETPLSNFVIGNN